ncbi:MAG: SGNH/GDSL hydrolase family protein [Flavobacteriales bacterium]|nr:SGNH/GDSL hydrolase family protein [Flavobacteriales bacterium]
MKKIFLSLATLFISLSAMAQNEQVKDTIVYTDALKFPVIGQITRQGFEDPYDRLPLVLKDSIRKELWDLGKNSSGVAVRFRSDSKRIMLRWTVLNNMWMNHMAPAGIKGLDLYALENGKWTFVGSGRPGLSKGTFTSRAIDNTDGSMREYMLYMSLYDCTTKVEIGTYSQSAIDQPLVNLPVREKPVVVYGTSITQGGCASRSGMSYTSILERWTNREFINLGFSGNGRLDYEIARLMAQADASLYIMDNMANCSTAQLDRLIPFVKILREKHPDTPILLLGNAHYTYRAFDTVTEKMVGEKNARLVELYKELKKTDKNIYYMDAEKMIGTDEEGTVDGTHFTNLGFMRMSEALYPTVDKLIKKSTK